VKDPSSFRRPPVHGFFMRAPYSGSVAMTANSVAWEVATMPERKHLRGVGEKEQRQYEHIKEEAKKEGRYGDRAEEVAARTVMKQHREKGHKKGR
jgi:hypothetical protein